ncbi:protein of unknown function DUF86 [Aquipluma nitroreducens]|uniref:DUF86 domain-containing protein n=1 Tax=Aquipluma nitroreducens TaxID=2010828 RepID=A0A5K7SBR6_9BACT|nr:DUF86 domain-containing protein [Aquipluma nitroreducens]BBE19031.1 protein of unknown function DUF86 [Aquipluma nitroreducens]
MSKEPLEYLRHIQDECLFVLSVIGAETKKEDLISNETLKRAVVRSLEIIGEATKKIPVDFKLKWNSINWKNMAGMRDRLIHDYMGVNYSIVWDVVKNKIPELSLQIQNVIDSEESNQ